MDNINRKTFLGMLLGLPALLRLSPRLDTTKKLQLEIPVNRCPASETEFFNTGVHLLPPNQQVEYVFGHDFSPIDYRCRRCGMSEMEFCESQKYFEQKNRYGETIEVIRYGGNPCLMDDFHPKDV